MDIDRFIAEHHAEWDRLDELVARGRRSVARLTPEELDELLALYQSSSAHLSVVRTRFDDISLSNRLSRSIGAARGLIYRKRANTANAIGRFFSETFPAACYASRRAIAVAAILLFVPAFGFGFWLHQSGEVRNAAIDPELQQLIATSEFEDYYSSQPAGGWAVQLFTHNIEVAVIAYAGGALGAIGGVSTLVENGASIGAAGAIMHSHGRGALFWGLITPHGLIELTSVCVAAGAGLRIAWAMVVPGDRTRGAALADEGLRSVVVILGTMVMFVVAGLTEAFITPSGLPTWTRVSIGVLIEVGALSWMFLRGRNLHAAGLTGRFGEPSLAELERDLATAGDAAAPRTPDQSRPADFTFT